MANLEFSGSNYEAIYSDFSKEILAVSLSNIDTVVMSCSPMIKSGLAKGSLTCSWKVSVPYKSVSSIISI